MSNGINVLMVDDELVVLEAFVDILEDEGYTMFTADSGDKAVQTLRANAIDIVVTDINMPGMDGLELLSIIRETDSDIPVIMATAYSSIESTVEAMRRGASNYLIKPIKVELLRSVLAEAATKRRTLRENREFVETIKRNDAERERVLEVLGQDLRQPLIDQMNWRELLMSDGERSLHTTRLESVAKVNSAANGMLAQVNDLLDEEKIKQRAETAQDPAEDVDECAVPEGQAPGETDPHTVSDETDPVDEATSQTGLEASFCPDIVPYAENRTEFKILLVENSSTLRDLLASVLRRRFHVFSASDGWEGLQLMVERPDLILTELNLPCVDAPDMLHYARQIEADIPILAMYNPKDKALLAATQRLEVQGLSKPFQIADLIRQVEALAESGGRQTNDTIVVVSPDATEQRALYLLLDTRYPTHIAASAEAALKMTDTHCDLLVVDVVTEEYPWQDIVASFRKDNRSVRVLALTDGKDKAIFKALKKVGVNSAILKPYAVDDLLLRVRDLLGIREIDGRIFRSVYRKLAI
jgi:DNA-binding NtrC family response regulator